MTKQLDGRILPSLTSRNTSFPCATSRICVCTSDSGRSLSDADILLIKSAWPCLRRLSSPASSLMKVKPGLEALRPSLPALVDLALACPQLETLDVEVASVTEDDLSRLENTSTGAPELGLDHSTAALRWLTLAQSGYRERIAFPTDIPRLARALHRLFPLVSGLGRPIEGSAKDGIRYHLWSRHDMTYDVFRVLDQLEKLKSQRASLLFLCSEARLLINGDIAACRHTYSELGVFAF